LAVGCSKQPGETPSNQGAAGSDDHHDDHVHGAGPHGGTIVEWGGGAYHLEFVVDHDAKSATVYVLGGDAKTPSPVKAEKLLLAIQEPAFEVELAAEPLDDESEGAASRFTGTHDSLGIVQEFAGTITGEVDGTPYAGDFAEEAGDHGHEH
jgi:hypothetical protein